MLKQIKWYPITEATSIPSNEGRRVTFNQHEVALFNLEGGYLAIDNRCPHKQGPLSDGIVSGKSVFCPLHNLKISLENGCALGGQGQVKTYPVKVLHQKVCIAFEEGAYQSKLQHKDVVIENQNSTDVN